MSEARKLDSTPSSGHEPDLFGDGVAEPAVELPSPAPAGPLPGGTRAPDVTAAVPRTAEAVPGSRAPRRSRRTSNAVLILFLVGLFAFACGVALAASVLLGMLDLQTGWVKDALGSAKEMLHHLTGK